jgi:hypothetical protein
MRYLNIPVSIPRVRTVGFVVGFVVGSSRLISVSLDQEDKGGLLANAHDKDLGDCD